MLASKHQPFLSMNADSSSIHTQNRQPTSHFLHYRSNFKQGKYATECVHVVFIRGVALIAVACEVAVWWEGDLHLNVYPLEEPVSSKSNAVHPVKHIPQASPVLGSCINEDSSLLALALKSGVVVVWSMKLGKFTS